MKIKKSKISSPKKLRANLLAKLRSIRRTTLQSKTRPQIIRRSRYRQYESDSDSDSDTDAKRSIKRAGVATSSTSPISVVTGGESLTIFLPKLNSLIRVRPQETLTTKKRKEILKIQSDLLITQIKESYGKKPLDNEQQIRTSFDNIKNNIKGDYKKEEILAEMDFLVKSYKIGELNESLNMNMNKEISEFTDLYKEMDDLIGLINRRVNKMTDEIKIEFEQRKQEVTKRLNGRKPLTKIEVTKSIDDNFTFIYENKSSFDKEPMLVKIKHLINSNEINLIEEQLNDGYTINENIEDSSRAILKLVDFVGNPDTDLIN